ncbi:MAG: HSP90 family protein [Planctomycetaceae bacterium]|nr:HSP90 family protein [Planctomycetaceae bacterium]
MTAQKNFQVNLRGMIELLSGHLYSGPQVYIRELLQNCVDAITARQQVDAEHVGEIRFELVTGGEGSRPTLVVSDNGIGLTEDDLHEFLATIGQSSKRGPEVQRDTFIGQFGIGLLSAFMVCEELVVITRSAKPDSKTVEWTGRSDGTYQVRVLEHDFEPGTQVFVRSRPGTEEFFEPDFIISRAKFYGSYLPHDIQVRFGDERRLINETAPWDMQFENRDIERDTLLRMGKETYEIDFIDAFRINTEVGGVQGVAFVLPHSASVASKRAHQVYLKNMLLSDRLDDLLPDWAFFVHCILNVTDLKPTASRESFHDDEDLDAARDAIGASLRGYLVDLSKTDKERLAAIINLHHLPMKSLAVDDDDFYKMFIDWLPFESSSDTITLGELCEQQEVIQYVPSRDQFRQIAGVAASQDMCIINAGYTWDVELLTKMPYLFPKRQIEQLDVTQLSQNFQDLTLDERDEVMDFLRTAAAALQSFRCEADIRRYEPSDLPTLYTASDEASFLRSVDQAKESANDLWGGVLDGFNIDHSRRAWANLCFNFSNPLIRKLASLSNREIIQRAVEMLYVQSLLLGHYPLKSGEMKLLGNGMLKMIEYCVSLSPENDE